MTAKATFRSTKVPNCVHETVQGFGIVTLPLPNVGIQLLRLGIHAVDHRIPIRPCCLCLAHINSNAVLRWRKKPVASSFVNRKIATERNL